MRIIAYLLFVISMMMTSCATLVTGITVTIYFDTDPYGATVYIDVHEVLFESTS